MDRLKEFEDYLEIYSFNIIEYLLKETLNLTLVVKSTKDWRKRPTYEKVIGFTNHHIKLGKFIQTARLGWVRINTCTFKLK